MDVAHRSQLLIRRENMNWTAVVITALICVTIAFLAAIGSDK